jgi:hypothetical protein
MAVPCPGIVVRVIPDRPTRESPIAEENVILRLGQRTCHEQLDISPRLFNKHHQKNNDDRQTPLDCQDIWFSKGPTPFSDRQQVRQKKFCQIAG